MLVADFAEPAQVALGRHQNAGGARHRLHDHRRDGGRILQRRQPLQVVRKVHAPLGLAPAEGLVLQIVGVADVIHAREQAAVEHAVLDDSADGRAAEVGAVVAPLAPDQPRLRALAPHVVIAERDLQRGIRRFRARVGEEHVVEIAGREVDQPVRELESRRVAELKGRREIHALGLRLDRRHDLLVPVACVAAPEPGGAVQNLATARRVVVHALGARHQARLLLVALVRRERHPEGFEVVGILGVVDVVERHGPGTWDRGWRRGARSLSRHATRRARREILNIASYETILYHDAMPERPLRPSTRQAVPRCGHRHARAQSGSLPLRDCEPRRRRPGEPAPPFLLSWRSHRRRLQAVHGRDRRRDRRSTPGRAHGRGSASRACWKR